MQYMSKSSHTFLSTKHHVLYFSLKKINKTNIQSDHIGSLCLSMWPVSECGDIAIVSSLTKIIFSLLSAFNCK